MTGSVPLAVSVSWVAVTAMIAVALWLLARSDRRRMLAALESAPGITAEQASAFRGFLGPVRLRSVLPPAAALAWLPVAAGSLIAWMLR